MIRTVLLAILFLSVILPVPAGPVRAVITPPGLPQDSPLGGDPAGSGEEDDLAYSYEQEIISRRVFQKRLPPLSSRERVIWSFRVAAKSPFL